MKEVLIQPAEEAVIDEEISAELSIQESSKYSEIVSKPESEMKVSDDEGDHCNSKSLTVLSSPQIDINDQMVRAIKIKSPKASH